MRMRAIAVEGRFTRRGPRAWNLTDVRRCSRSGCLGEANVVIVGSCLGEIAVEVRLSRDRAPHVVQRHGASAHVALSAEFLDAIAVELLAVLKRLPDAVDAA